MDEVQAKFFLAATQTSALDLALGRLPRPLGEPTPFE